MRTFSLFAILLAGFILVGCTREITYRYKLTIEVETPDGIKSGFNVVEIGYPYLPHYTKTWVRGEALYIDLGAGRRPLVALLTGRLPEFSKGPRDRWRGRQHPSFVLSRVYGIPDGSDPLKRVQQIAAQRGAKEIELADLPTVVTFDLVSDPGSVRLIDPERPEEALGSGVSIARATIEVTTDPVTLGLEEKLPWLPGRRNEGIYLDGQHSSDGKTLANELSKDSFMRGR